MDRRLIKKYNIINNEIDILNPLSVGNGNFAVTVDVTGSQSLYDSYNIIPLLSMSNKCYVSTSLKKDIKLKEYQSKNHISKYMTDKTNQEENFEFLRHYPYKFNFFTYRILYNDKVINGNDIKDIRQELDIYTGAIKSQFKLNDNLIETIVKLDSVYDVFRFEIKSNIAKQLKIQLLFPKANWNSYGSLYPLLDKISLKGSCIYRQAENDVFKAYIRTNGGILLNNNILELDNIEFFEISINDNIEYKNNMSSYFDKINIKLLSNEELNRRMVLSLYLLKVNCQGIYPPQETGLTMNSWNSKFHLEMHPLHCLWMAKCGLHRELLSQLDYYLTIEDEALKRANTQGYKGARLPKMTSPLGEDSPSNIGCLLLWQQPHLFLMLDEIYRNTLDASVLNKYYSLLKNLILFLESFLYKEENIYHLDYPIIPAQENYNPNETKNPIFELEYVRYAFIKMIEFSRILNYPIKEIWCDIINNIALPPQDENVYLATSDAQGLETYGEFAYDHPLVLMPYSFIISDRIDKKKMNSTIDKVLSSYCLEELWGWDFPIIAMALCNLERYEEALEMLLLETPKNTFLKNGHNMQGDRSDLPLYLPGNGAFLLAYINLSNRHK